MRGAGIGEIKSTDSNEASVILRGVGVLGGLTSGIIIPVSYINSLTVKKGDVNNDGKLNLLDVQLLLRVYLKLAILE